MANLSNINNKFLVTTTGEVLVSETGAAGAGKLWVKNDSSSYTRIANFYNTTDNSIPYITVGNQAAEGADSCVVFAFADSTTEADKYGWIGMAGDGVGTGIHWKRGGNVGIGTTTPSSFSGYTNLSLKAGSIGNNLDFFNSAGTRIGAIVTDGSDDVILEASGLSRNLIFKTDNAGTFSEKMRITSAGNIQFAQDGYINTNTADASDNLSLQLSGGGAFGDTRGACIALAGNENGNGGLMQLRAGDGSVGGIRYYTGGSERMRLGGRLISFNPTTGVQEIRGDVASAKFAIGNMGDASSQMMVSSRGFLTLNTSNTGSALDATERMRIDGNGQMTYQGAEPGTTGIRFQGSGTCNGYAGSLLNFYAMDVMRDQGSGKAMNVQGTIDIAAGYGIGFGASAGGGATSTLLDDYEEGTWTPVAYASSGTATGSYSEQLGTYTKTGRQVICMFDITVVLSGTMAGFAGISGLPFTVGTSSATGGGMAGYSVNQFRSSNLFAVAGAGRQISGFPQQNASYIYCQVDNSGVNGFGSAGQATWNIGTSGRCTGYVIYFTN